ncbi:PKD domain-containing protein [Parabacteroides sp. PF5-9]|uniref:PKD domain-containing protein n=1 Tax=Parabacteroides sp. PF5-9 TaxID=1742404 RepID=UPI00247568A4|nr:PKD domain-containing protein [Parabacteroides sp. PF5-9]MDH6357185.1 hypothetical protein [Parabacteroides sp. PF5-9]
MKSMRVLCIVGLMATTVFSVQAQKEATNWFFGNRAGLTWNTTRDLAVTGLNGTPDTLLTGLPTDVTGSSISTTEGCFSLSDAKGNLLFYSDGISIWNKNHATMPNGTSMTGNGSSSQSGIIIPYPGNRDKYIAVTIGVTQNTLSYSVIDMTLDGGLGDVETPKNIRLLNHSGSYINETVTSIKHANGKDYWIVAPGRGNPTYMNAWLLTQDGVEETPVSTLLSVTNTQSGVGGYMKFTPDGKHFAWAGWGNRIMYGDFDAATGGFSNVRDVDPSVSSKHYYGVEFSASGKYVYIMLEGRRQLYVYNFHELLAASDPSVVSYQEIDMIDTYNCAIQLALDGRIYMTTQANFLNVIDNPEEYDNLRIYKLPAAFLSGTSTLGLPSFAANWFSVSIEADQSFCVNTSQDFTVILNQSGSDEIAYTEWDFGEGGSFLKDTNVSSGTQTHSYTYEKPGMYNITVRSYLVDGKEVASETITVKVNPCVIPVNPNVHLFQ